MARSDRSVVRTKSTTKGRGEVLCREFKLMMYGSECWALHKKDRIQMKVAEMRMQKWVLGLWLDGIRS